MNLQQKNIMIKTATIIGNGSSRKTLDLEKSEITTFGCNAIYRDYTPDWLVAIDDKIIQEIKNSNYPQSRFIIPPEELCYEPVAMYEKHLPSNKFEDVKHMLPRSNAGMAAMQVAIDKGFERLYCVGFDFLVFDEDIAVSNLYNGTNGYELETRANLSDTRNRMKYLAYMIENNPKINFHFIYPDNLKIYAPIADNVRVGKFSEYKELIT